MTDLNDARRPPEADADEGGGRRLVVSFPWQTWRQFKALVPKGEWNRWIVAAVEARCQEQESK